MSYIETGPRGSSAYYKALYDRASRLTQLGAWECDLDTGALSWTAGVYGLFGMPANALVDRPYTLDLYHPESRIEMERLRAAAIRERRGFTLDCRIRTIAGEERWMRLTAAFEGEGNGRPRLFGMKQDITREREAVEKLRRLAESDPLTGLASRALFEERFLSTAGGGFSGVPIAALLLVDVDRFKGINDHFGHLAGDASLQAIGDRLRRAFPDALLIARIGGDEFAIVMGGDGDPALLLARLGPAQAVLDQPLFWKDRRIMLSTSIGGTVADHASCRDPRRLFAEADEALYMAKAAGRSRARLFGIAMPDDTAAAHHAAHMARFG